MKLKLFYLMISVMFKTFFAPLFAALVALLAGPLWGQDIQKLLLHAQESKTIIEMVFLSGNRFEMQVSESKSGSLYDPQASTQVLRGSAKRVADRMELSIDGRSIGYVQMWTGTGQIQAQLYWGDQQAPRAFIGTAFRLRPSGETPELPSNPQLTRYQSQLPRTTLRQAHVVGHHHHGAAMGVGQIEQQIKHTVG